MIKDQAPQPHIEYVFSEEAIRRATPVIQDALPLVSTDRPENITLHEELADILRDEPITIKIIGPRESLDEDSLIDDFRLLEGLRLATQQRIDEARGLLQPNEHEDDERGLILIEPMQPKDKVVPEDIVVRMEHGSAVKTMPRLAEQVRDTSRTTEFTYEERAGIKGKVVAEGVATEHKGLVELWDYLRGFMKISTKGGFMRNKRVMHDVQSLVDNLNFVGEEEYQEAALGIGEFWKSYLDKDPDRKICILTEVGKLERYTDMRKSDEYLRDEILKNFTPDELYRYSGRIVTKLQDLDDNDPKNTRVVILDDWTISGRQMRDIYAKLHDDPIFDQYQREGSVEVNVIIVSQDRITNGLAIDPYDETKGAIPLRAYYVSHNAKRAQREQKAHITGLHSSVNYDFGSVLIAVHRCRSIGAHYSFPALASVKRSYREEKSETSVSRYAIMRVPEDELEAYHGA